MKTAIHIVLFSLSASLLKAQLMDSIGILMRGKYSIDARLESRNSFIDHRLVSVTGLRLGLAYQRKLRIGGGISWLKSDFTVPGQPAESSDTRQRLQHLKFVYVCYYVDFVFHKTKRWQLSVPIQAGTGLSWFQYGRSYSIGNSYTKYLLLLYEPGITAQFKVFKWAGLGADIAYRFAYNNNSRAAQTLNSPTYSFKLLVWFDQLYYELLPQSAITKKYGPAFW